MPTDTKVCKRTTGAAAAVQAKHGDSCFANQVDPNPMCLTSFGDDSTGPSTLPCSRNDALVDTVAAARKSCLSPLEMRTSTAAGVLLPVGTASTATRTTFDQPPLCFCPNEEINLRTSIQYAMDYSRFWKMKVSQTKLMQTMMFDPGGSKGCLHACPFLGTWRALLCGEVLVLERLVAIWSVFLQKEGLGISFLGMRCKQLVCIAVDRCFLRSQAGEYAMPGCGS